MGRLAGKSVVVTGGARGIGEGMVRRFVAEGARCVIADIDVEAGERLAAELGDAVVFMRTDVTSEDDIVAAIDACVSRFGALDVMVNNAGVVGRHRAPSRRPGWRTGSARSRSCRPVCSSAPSTPSR